MLGGLVFIFTQGYEHKEMIIILTVTDLQQQTTNITEGQHI